jgi:diguanylate cyclase (GGDEF)-like protein
MMKNERNCIEWGAGSAPRWGQTAADDLPLKQPHIRYKAAFLLGGASFAAASYLVGTLLFEAENRLFDVRPYDSDSILGSIRDIVPYHLLTLVPWIVGTTLVSIALGYLFDKQVRFRMLSEALRQRAEQLAVVDSLTLAYNHGYFMQRVSEEIGRSERPPTGSFALLFIDVDDFKKYNDAHGHLAGDDALRRVVTVIRQTVRQADVVARYGGEELVVMAPDTDAEQGLSVAERIRANVALHTPVTVSIGVSAFPEDAGDPDALVGTADRAMYRAKQHGKNCVQRIPAPPRPVTPSAA